LLASSGVLKLFGDFSCFITTSINGRFFGYGFLSTVLNNGLLAYGFAHATAATHAKAAWLEGGEATVTAWAHHLHTAHASSEVTSEKVVFVEAHAHSHAGEWVSILAGLFLRPHAIEAHAHLAKSTAKSSAKEVVIVIEEVGERILAVEELSEYLVSGLHVESLEVGATAEAPMETTTTATSLGAPILDILSAVSVIIFTFFWIRKNTVGIGNFLENFFSLLLVVGVLVRMVFQRQFAIGLLDCLLVHISI
jgi:hypothetical protein